MRLKLDENLSHDLADELKRRGHDVDTVLDEQLGGRKDPVVVQAATDDDRMVITLDRGVGDIRSFPSAAVSHETIYRTLFVQSRGALKRELTAHLRTRRQVRQPGNRNRARGTGKGQLVDIVHISQRPAEADDRAVPGHWEGDLIFGEGMSSIGTLVERSSRFVMLFKPDGNRSEQVIAALREQVLTLPDQLW